MQLFPIVPDARDTDLNPEWPPNRPCGDDAAKMKYVLRATAKVGTAWRALLLDGQNVAHVVTEKTQTGTAKISAGKLECVNGSPRTGGPTYLLTAP
jgi:hypothetical protein